MRITAHQFARLLDPNRVPTEQTGAEFGVIQGMALAKRLREIADLVEAPREPGVKRLVLQSAYSFTGVERDDFTYTTLVMEFAELDPRAGYIPSEKYGSASVDKSEPILSDTSGAKEIGIERNVTFRAVPAGEGFSDSV